MKHTFYVQYTFCFHLDWAILTSTLHRSLHAFLCKSRVHLAKYFLSEKCIEQKLWSKLKHLLGSVHFPEASWFLRLLRKSDTLCIFEFIYSIMSWNILVLQLFMCLSTFISIIGGHAVA
jgi:hypothetical protein